MNCLAKNWWTNKQPNKQSQQVPLVAQHRVKCSGKDCAKITICCCEVVNETLIVELASFFVGWRPLPDSIDWFWTSTSIGIHFNWIITLRSFDILSVGHISRKSINKIHSTRWTPLPLMNGDCYTICLCIMLKHNGASWRFWSNRSDRSNFFFLSNRGHTWSPTKDRWQQ